MENPKEYVTHIELELEKSRMRSDWKRDIRSVDERHTERNEKTNERIDEIMELVLPMAESSKQTAENTRKTAELMERFTDEQRRTNGKFYDKLHVHDLQFSGIEGQFTDVSVRLNAQSESKKSNTTLWVALIGLIGIFISGIFALAPSLFS